MKIILKNISVKTRKQDIKNFLQPAVRGGWLNKTGEIKSILILPLRNTRTHIVHYHGLVEILPDIVAERVMKRLNRKIMAGKHVAISEYKTRSQSKDLRHIKDDVYDDPKNKRIFDRRDDYEHQEIHIVSRVLVFDKDQ